MKKPIGIMLLVFSVLLSSTLQAQQEKQMPDFTYKKEEFLLKTSHLRAELDPLQAGFQGRHISLGVGGRILAYHFVDKFSIDFSYLHRYFSLLPDEQRVGFSQFDNMAPFKGREMSFGLSYSLSKKELEIDEPVSLRASKDVHTITTLPMNVSQMFDLRAGMVFYDLPGQVGFNTALNLDHPTIHFMQNSRALSLGISRKRLQNDIFTTNIFGTIKHSAYSEFFVDFLYDLAPSFPDQLYRVIYPAGSSSVEPSSFVNVNDVLYNEIKNSMTYNPFGGQMGFRTGSMTHGFGFLILAGYRPGFINQNDFGYLDNLSLSVTLSYHFPVLLH